MVTHNANKELDGSVEIYFTCFDRAHKELLDSWAKESGCIVRSGVTKDLSLLVCGPRFRGNIGAAKHSKALRQGAEIEYVDQISNEDELLEILSAKLSMRGNYFG